MNAAVPYPNCAALFDFAEVSFFSLARDGTIVQANLAAVRLLRLDDASGVGKEFIALIAEEDAALFRDFLALVFSTDSHQQCEVKLSAGLPLQRSVRIQAIRVGDGRECHAVVVDIDERAWVEKLAQHAEARTQRLVRAASVGLWEWNLKKNEVYFSPEWKRQLGYSDDEIANRFEEWQKRVHPDDLARALAAAKDFCDGRAPAYNIEIRLRHRDGLWRWIHGEAELERDEKGEPVLMMGSQIDITRVKRAEERLRQYVERTQRLLRGAAVGLWEWNLLTDEVYFSIEWKRQLGYEEDEIEARFEEWQTRVHPDDLAGALASVSAVREGRLPRYSVEMRMLHKDGKWRWIRADAELERDENGNPATFLGSHIDVTERKQMLEALAASEEQLRRLLQNLAVGVVVHGPDTRIMLHNQRAQELLGLSDDQMLGKVAMDPAWCFVREDDTPMPLSEYPVVRIVETRAPVHGLVLGIRRPVTDDCVWVIVDAFPEFTPSGELQQAVVTFVDISERRAAEQARAALEVQLRQSQKMEALGILAGGVAHDFNNIVATIMGNSALAREDARAQPEKVFESL